MSTIYEWKEVDQNVIDRRADEEKERKTQKYRVILWMYGTQSHRQKTKGRWKLPFWNSDYCKFTVSKVPFFCFLLLEAINLIELHLISPFQANLKETSPTWSPHFSWKPLVLWKIKSEWFEPGLKSPSNWEKTTYKTHFF